MRGFKTQVSSSILATSLVLSIGSAAAAVQDATTEVHLCDLVDVAELSAVSGLSFEPLPGQSTMCNVSGLADDDPASILVTTRAGVLDDVRQDGSADVTVSGAPGLANVVDGNANVYVQLADDRLLSLSVLAGAVGSSDLGVVELGVSVAEGVIENMLAAAPDEPAEAVVSLAPPDVEGLDMDAVRFDGDGEALREQVAGMADAFAPLLEAFGAEPSSMTMYQADSGGVNTAPGYQAYIALRIDGAGDGELGPAFLRVFGLADNPDIETADAEVGGRSVTVLRPTEQPDTVAYLYDAGDTAYLIQMDEELAARLLAALP